MRSHRECAAKLRQFDTMFQERRGVVLGIYSTLNRLVGLLEISQINPQVESVTLSSTWPGVHRPGYASAAVRATTEYLFRTVGCGASSVLCCPSTTGRCWCWSAAAL